MQYAQATAMLLAIFSVVLVLFAIRGARRTRSMADFALGSQGFPPYIVALSLAASLTSAATFIINPGFVAYFGWSAFVAMGLMLPVALFVSLIVLTKSFRRYGASVKAATLAQWMGKRYGSDGLTTWFALLSMLLVTFMVLICVGLTKVLAQALDAPAGWVLFGIVAFVFGYMMYGGANTMVYTNAVQASLMIVVAIMLLSSGASGWSGLWSRLSSIDPMMVSWFNPASPLFRDAFEVIFCNIVVGVAIVCQPHIITRSLMLRDSRDVNRYLLLAILAQSLFFMVLFVGFFARELYPDLQRAGTSLPLDGVMSAYVIDTFPVYAGLLVIIGLLSAGLSTLEGLIQSLSTTITTDILAPRLPFLADAAHPERLKRTNRAVIVALALVTGFWSHQQINHPNLSVGILAQNGVYAFFAAAFVPVLLGVFAKKVHPAAPAWASLTAIVVHFAVYYGGLTPYTNGTVRNPAVACTLAIIAALLVGISLYRALPYREHTADIHHTNPEMQEKI